MLTFKLTSCLKNEPPLMQINKLKLLCYTDVLKSSKIVCSKLFQVIICLTRLDLDINWPNILFLSHDLTIK